MTKEKSETRAKYEPPILEQQAAYVVLTGISLPIGTNILEEESE